MARLYIDDGLTFTETVTPAPRFDADGKDLGIKFVELSITFRPPLSDDQMLHEDACRLRGPDALTSMHKFLEKHLVAWDATDNKDAPLSLDPKLIMTSLRHIPPEYIIAMRNKIIDSVEKFYVLQKN